VGTAALGCPAELSSAVRPEQDAGERCSPGQPRAAIPTCGWRGSCAN